MSALRLVLITLTFVAGARLVRQAERLAAEVRAARRSLDDAAESGARLYRQLQLVGRN